MQFQAIICPKCQYKRTAEARGPAWQCPNCGVAYNKAKAPIPPLDNTVNNAANKVGNAAGKVSNTANRAGNAASKVGIAASKVANSSRASGDRETQVEECETATPPLIGLSMAGRIGRLRYLAFAWPIFVLGSFLGMVAAVILPQHSGLGMLLLIVAGVLCVWMPLRLMALRIHDVNLSAKWILGLLLLPGVAGALGAPHMVMMCAGIFWIAGLLLVALPGSAADNNYGPPPGENTTLIKVGAGIVLFLMALGVAGNISMMNSGKLNSVLSRDPRTAAEPGSASVHGTLPPHLQGGAARMTLDGAFLARNN